VFARSLADCMALQLAAQGALTPTYQKLLDNIALLGKGDIVGLAKAAGLSPDDVPPYLQAIRSIDPRPAKAFESTADSVARPDVIVLEGEAGWQAYLNEETLPHVLVLERDWEEMATRKITDDERAFMKANVQSARWLKKATQQRAATLLRVSRAIVAHQHAFFKDGMLALQPLVLRDIAEALELHESTISRSSAGKLVQTPSGVFHLKDLFSTSLGNCKKGDNKQPVSSAAIKARLAQLVKAEQGAQTILSDDALVDLLAEDGFILARRTVAKYRNALNIGSSSQRRRAAKIAAAAKET
jgi:RNA polymerase sigma-54 factor